MTLTTKQEKFFILLMCLLLSACSGQRQDTLIVAGSTSVQPYAEVLAEEYGHLRPDKIVDIQGGGSSAGIAAAEAGTAAIGMSSRNLKGGELVLWSVEIAIDGLAIIVHPSNTLTNLSAEDVREIYTGSLTDWGKLGGTPGKIHVISREEGSGTRSAFEELVMGKDRITPKAIIQDSNGSVRQLVSSDSQAIGFISLGLVDHTVAALSLDGIAAREDKVLDGSYKLFRPFLFVTLAAPEGSAREFIDFVLSPQGQEILLQEGLVPRREEKP
ncbi:MAG: phosphate ABC transporter substrate-binding protein [Symbiobacteriaceae bacterium]|nr:phosphate ABC transporter substrate-binding protein [Symbiobacteriaceae bacterium]